MDCLSGCSRASSRRQQLISFFFLALCTVLNPFNGQLTCLVSYRIFMVWPRTVHCCQTIRLNKLKTVLSNVKNRGWTMANLFRALRGARLGFLSKATGLSDPPLLSTLRHENSRFRISCSEYSTSGYTFGQKCWKFWCSRGTSQRLTAITVRKMF